MSLKGVMYMNPIVEDILMHYGMPKRSGRYPWGSGDNPYQHSGDFLSRVDELRSQDFEFTDEDGNTYTGDLAIAKSMGLSTTQFRTQLSLANAERRKLDVDRAKSLRADGKSLNEIAQIMGFKNDSSVRTLLNENSEAKMNQAQKTADFLKKQIDEKGMIDVGAGVERSLNVSREKLNQALYILEMQGYPVYNAGVPQVTNPGKQTIIKVIGPPGTKYKEVYDYKNVHSIGDEFISSDGGDTFDPKFVYPKSMDSKRLKIRYADEGGVDKDGVIELRRGVDDLDLGGAHYAQVRIMVDGTHYLKGMAVYSDDMPPGVDVIFNTNKNKDVPVMGPKNNTILKPIKNDPDNPFGSLIKEGVSDPDVPGSKGGGQSYYYDKDGNKQLSLINKRAEEGDWGEWADALPSQFLSKQNMSLIRKQLNLASADKEEELSEILELNNPTIKKALLKSFADDCDAAAVHLKAAALPRQQYQVILPLTTIKDNEVYAPNYKNGETVALIRYPHAGIFEIPILKVNNKLKEGEQIFSKNPKDMVGISKKVADQLSGADFDGDTVMVIPCNSSSSNVHITSSSPLEGLVGFDPKFEYGGKPDGTFKKMKDTQKQMGVISNLITDMTLQGATDDELARAVRHSMVVIDAEKHDLDYKQSELDNGIAALKRKYQGHIDETTGRYREGASTLISKSKSEQLVLKRKGSPKIDPETGEQSYKEVREEYVDKSGKTQVRMQKSTKMAETKDARTLSSGTPQEEAYASYANKMKALANQARKEIVSTKDRQYSSQARQIYQKEYDSLDAKLSIALLNAPRERQAQMMANSIVNAKKKENPDMTKAEIKKAKQQALTAARTKVGAKRSSIDITDREWEAIQAGAISANQLSQIIANTDIDKLRQRATPRTRTELSPAKQNKITSMMASGYTNKEIADSMNISVTTVAKYANEK